MEELDPSTVYVRKGGGGGGVGLRLKGVIRVKGLGFRCSTISDVFLQILNTPSAKHVPCT